MMDTACKQQQGLWQHRQSLQNMGHSLNDDLLAVSLQHRILIHGYGRKTAAVAKLRSRQYHAPQAALGAYEYLMALRQQHSDMDNGPSSPGRGAVFQSVCKRCQAVHLGQGKGRILPRRSVMQSLKHRPSSPLPPRRPLKQRPPFSCTARPYRCQDKLP